MNILNIHSNLNNSTTIKNKPSFKAGNISPVLKNQLQSTISKTASKDIFTKLASIAGLTAIITWLKSLNESKNSNPEIQNKLDIIDTKWTQKGEELFLNPDTRDNYLDLVSTSDDIESIIWTKGLLAENNDSAVNSNKTVDNEALELFVSDKSNETFMSVSANKVVTSILNQLKAIEKADSTTRETILKDVDNKLNGLIKQADDLQNNEATSETYSKLANIAKMFAFVNILKDSATDKKELESVENVEMKNEETAQEEVLNVEVKDENITEKTEELETSKSKSDKAIEIEVPDELKPKIQFVKTVDLSQFETKRKEKSATNQDKEQLTLDMVKTPDNEEFINNVFLKAFKIPKVKPNIYAKHINFIKQIYDTYGTDKEKVKKYLIKSFNEKDMTEALDKYFEYTNGTPHKFEYLNFVSLEEFAQQHGDGLTLDDFIYINNAKDNIFKYHTINGDKVDICFLEEITAEERLNFINNLHQILFNLGDDDLIKGFFPEEITLDDIAEEFAYRLTSNINDYPNICKFLNLDISVMEDIISTNNKLEDIEEKIRLELENPIYKEKLKALIEILNNKNFEKFIVRPHAKMRFLERFVFRIPETTEKFKSEIIRKTSAEINKLKKAMEKAKTITFLNYTTIKNDTKKEGKFGPRVILYDYTFGLNEYGQIHTIF